jgi:hypothetical protein
MEDRLKKVNETKERWLNEKKLKLQLLNAQKEAAQKQRILVSTTEAERRSETVRRQRDYDDQRKSVTSHRISLARSD